MRQNLFKGVADIIQQIVYKKQLYIIGKLSDVMKHLKKLEKDFNTIEDLIIASKKRTI